MTPLLPPASPFAVCCSPFIGRLTRRLCRYFTMDIMRDPVVAVDGFTCAPRPLLLTTSPSTACHDPSSRRLSHTAAALSLTIACSYERCSIEAWIATGKTTSPKTGAELSSEGHGARGGIACSAA